jgi:hypothetical protein
VYLIVGGQVLVYLGFNAALGRWPSTRVYAWTFLVPVVAVAIEAVQGAPRRRRDDRPRDRDPGRRDRQPSSAERSVLDRHDALATVDP